MKTQIAASLSNAGLGMNGDAMIDLPPGWKFEPLYRNCPRCGFDLSKEFVYPEQDKPGTERIESEAAELSVTRVAPNHAARHDFDLQRMIDPLTKPDPENAERNKRGWRYRKSFKKPRARKNEDENTNDHQHLIPVIKCNFGKRIIQWFLRVMS